MSPMFSEGVTIIFGEFFYSFLHYMDRLFYLISLEVSALVSGFMIFISCCSMFPGVSEFSDRLSGGVLF